MAGPAGDHLCGEAALSPAGGRAEEHPDYYGGGVGHRRGHRVIGGHDQVLRPGQPSAAAPLLAVQRVYHGDPGRPGGGAAADLLFSDSQILRRTGGGHRHLRHQLRGLCGGAGAQRHRRRGPGPDGGRAQPGPVPAAERLAYRAPNPQLADANTAAS